MGGFTVYSSVNGGGSGWIYSLFQCKWGVGEGVGGSLVYSSVNGGGSGWIYSLFQCKLGVGREWTIYSLFQCNCLIILIEGGSGWIYSVFQCNRGVGEGVGGSTVYSSLIEGE